MPKTKLSRIVPVTDNGKRIRVEDNTLNSFINMSKLMRKYLKKMKKARTIKEQDKYYDKLWDLVHDFEIVCPYIYRKGG